MFPCSLKPKRATASIPQLPHYRWENPRTQRYYQAIVQQNLLAEWEVFCAWGGLGTRLGHGKTLPAESYEHALEILAALAIRRHQHHYQRVTP